MKIPFVVDNGFSFVGERIFHGGKSDKAKFLIFG
jgi:hypothetical protein